MEITAFNGTAAAITVADLQGTINDLPSPQIKSIAPARVIQRKTEFYITLEQRVPAAIAETMAKSIGSGLW